ncbi:MAG: polysaccharide deacetylase family protein [Limnospira sp. PMC 1291.21]|uniref:Polysaccharide deacetylase n=4 Tax=Limnospira TaxID=2596745 RepID=B5VYK5_LIMMA|nr:MULTISPECIES: polysaccharide deacetylase family protein [Limnospira]EKD06955.1 polysaccharide deacetylase [Arthrospira platensis C1]MDC0840634.1 polysaccharide deacetylase family protein [Limnoraphis robusta]QJB26197.1 polysaccharide deacetylase family protein [Limnospira fusiformis SAG 85.79]EDZ95625.1 polysaccharide deacetylase [Limnospira maxima CS-328]MDT9178688.1 polysaccharide deacetylase family protein [Limnospira sp. PMC 1238.20]
MVQPYYRVYRRQQRVLTLAILAALSSFVMGVALPWTLHIDREARVTYQPPISQQVAAERQTQGEVENSNNSRQLPVPNLGIPGVKLALTQRLQSTQSALNELENERFTFSVPQRFQGTTIKEVNLPPERKVIALTFDDGPWPRTTEQVLDILRKNNIKATFFLIGAALNNNKEIAKKVADEGHALANHTWNHRYHQVSQAEAAKEINSTGDLIEEVTGTKTALFRPPGGVMTNGLVQYVHSQNQANIMWSVDSADWRSGTDAIARNVLTQAQPGGIVLMHDGGGNRAPTVAALPRIIAELKRQGYEFVTIPELLEIADEYMSDEDIASQEQKAREMSESDEMPMYQSPLPY